MLRVVDESPRNEDEFLVVSTLDELACEGAHRMLMTALEAEEAAYIERHKGELDGEGRRLVVPNGHARPRSVTMGWGTVEVSAPKANDRRTDAEGNRLRFTSKTPLLCMRRSPKVAEVLPVLYLRGLYTGNSREDLPIPLGEEATSGLSPTTISSPTDELAKEYDAFRTGALPARTSFRSGPTACTSASDSRTTACARWCSSASASMAVGS